MAGFGADAIAIVTGGLRRDTGTFAERLVTGGYRGDIPTVIAIFVSLQDAEYWGRLKTADQTYIETHAQRNYTGVISVRALTWIDLAVKTGRGDWIELTEKTQ